MPVFEGSRYENAAVIRVEGADGKVRPALYSMVSANVSQTLFRTYIVQDGDRYDTLANDIFGDPEMWWAIADINPEFLYPASLAPGSVIRLPAV